MALPAALSLLELASADADLDALLGAMSPSLLVSPASAAAATPPGGGGGGGGGGGRAHGLSAGSS